MEPTQDPNPSTPPSPPAAPTPSFAEQRRAARPWYLQPKTAIWLGPLLIVACLVLRFGWGGSGASRTSSARRGSSSRTRGSASATSASAPTSLPSARMARVAPTIGSLVLVGVVAFAATTAPADARRDRFTVTSPAFADGEPIPEGFTCDGANASLPLVWRKIPKGTTELALVMDDPDTRVGTFVHWVAWGIEPKPRRLPEETLPANVVEGASGTGSPGYRGPCPPTGDGPHRYRVTMYALDESPAVTAGTATADDLRAAIEGHVLAKDRTVGTYER